MNDKKKSLRNVLENRRDNMSEDMKNILSKDIFKKLNKIKPYIQANDIASYYSTNSEVLTQSIMQKILSDGKKLYLPRISNENLELRQVVDVDSLEMGSLNIPEPRSDASIANNLDVILVPAIGVSRNGDRLGYGKGYYDRYLSGVDATKIALVYSSQIIGSIPTTFHDIKMDWIVSEDEIINTSI